MSEPTIGTLAWLREHALFSCRVPGCAEDHTFPAKDLRLDLEGRPICEFCWDDEMWLMGEQGDDGEKDPPGWHELRQFDPFKGVCDG